MSIIIITILHFTCLWLILQLILTSLSSFRTRVTSPVSGLTDKDEDLSTEYITGSLSGSVQERVPRTESTGKKTNKIGCNVEMHLHIVCIDNCHFQFTQNTFKENKNNFKILETGVLSEFKIQFNSSTDIDVCLCIVSIRFLFDRSQSETLILNDKIYTYMTHTITISKLSLPSQVCLSLFLRHVCMCVHVRTWVCACMCALCVSVSKKHSGLPPFVVDGRYQKKTKKLYQQYQYYIVYQYITHIQNLLSVVFSKIPFSTKSVVNLSIENVGSGNMWKNKHTHLK